MAFNELLPIVELCCISFTGWNWKGVLAEVFKDFTLAADKREAYASHEYDALEGGLEPEPVSLLDIHQQRGGGLTSTRAEPQDPAKIFSAPELRNNVRFIQTAYDAFGLNDDEYSILSLLVSAFSRYREDDYFIRIEIGKFRSMLAAQTVSSSVELERMLLGGDAHFKQARKGSNRQVLLRKGMSISGPIRAAPATRSGEGAGASRVLPTARTRASASDGEECMRSKRRIRPEDAVSCYILEIKDWDWSYSFGANDRLVGA
ncbi:hypothetical protein [Bradyrhizobium zhanjiangense]|nr:hypothetical protein [Bradyrhizobium zhanjiangense]